VPGDEAAFGDGGAGMIVVQVLGGFALIALLLAGTGVFSVSSQSVAQRTREFGIRMAIGATPRGVLGLVLARETKLIAAALVSGAGLTLGLTRALFAELAALSATAPSGSHWWDCARRRRRRRRARDVSNRAARTVTSSPPPVIPRRLRDSRFRIRDSG